LCHGGLSSKKVPGGYPFIEVYSFFLPGFHREGSRNREPETSFFSRRVPEDRKKGGLGGFYI